MENAAQADAEPADLAPDQGQLHPRRPLRPDARGRWTACAPAGLALGRLGYKLTVPISMANDYNGYIATYREYQRGDHYRKALTGVGPPLERLHGHPAGEHGPRC